jgi:hypothetical protein
VASAAPFRLLFQPEPIIRAAAFQHEAAVFGRTYGVTYPDHVAEFAPYESASAFMVVLDATDDVVATMRLITPGPAGLKTLNEASGPPWWIDGLRSALAVGIDPSRTWDVGTLAVARGVGRHRFAVTAALYHGLALAGRRNGVGTLLMTVDERVRRILESLGLFTSALPGAQPGPFCGSPASTPVFAHFAPFLDHQRRVNPEAYRMVTLGGGLTDVAIPPVEHFDLLERAVFDPAFEAPLASAIQPA